MTINWIKCSDRMPPDGETIFKIESLDKYFVLNGSIFEAICDEFVIEGTVWIPFDEATWKELNR